MATVPSAEAGSVPRRDIRLAVLVAVLLLVGSGVSLEDDFEVSLTGNGWPGLPGLPGVLLVLVASLPLAFRRVAPLPVLAVTGAASAASPVLGLQPEPLPLGVLVALYTVAVVRRPLVSSVAAAAYVVVFTVGTLAGIAPLTDDQYYIDLVSVVATVMVGYGVALNHARAVVAEQRATAMARHQEARTRAAVTQEQARIAREVHDIVAHDVSVMVAQAGAARRVFDSEPRTAAAALTSIEAVGRDALDGLRRLVTLLRTDLRDDDRSPQPDLDRLPWLLAQVETAGLPVDFTILGRPRRLPATVELNAFRIVQESLTNILKHAGPTRATVVLDYGETDLRIEVGDGGTGGEGVPSAGYGLVSMQQRAGMLGGELHAGPSGRGFVVSARLPIAPVVGGRPHDPDPPATAEEPRQAVEEGVP